jgi:uracil-DNA glycosylase family 4
MVIAEWQVIQQAIQTCRRCETEQVPYLKVPRGQKRKPSSRPVRPVRLYFVSVAPPWGGAYFWDETKRDAVREGLFTALISAVGMKIRNCDEFIVNSFFLSPAVKCPSMCKEKDHAPSRQAIRYCQNFLLDELLAAQPERILALGKVPFESLCDRFNLRASKKVSEFRKEIWRVRLGGKEVLLSGTYFPGNNRNNQRPLIEQDINRILKEFPRNDSA